MAIAMKPTGRQRLTFIRVFARTLIICGFVWINLQNNGFADSNILKELGLNSILSGKTQEQEENRALLEDEAEQGNAEAQTDLSVELRKEGRMDEAKHWAIKAANQGQVTSQINLGVFLEEEGKIDEAKKWYLKAIEQGDARAENNLALLLQKEGKMDEAMKLFRSSAEKGDVHGQYNLAQCFEKQGKDALAKVWYRRAADQDHIQARQKLRIFGIF